MTRIFPRLSTAAPLLALAAAIACRADAPTMTSAPAPFEPTWESLHHNEVPAWFRDAKFGISLHWGVFSVPEKSGWYARQLYLSQGSSGGDTVYRHHVARYGHPSQFGFKDLIPLWKAEHWDPDALAAFFRQIGARYVVPVAVHHDNFDNYASTYQPWNSVNMGPHRDIIGDWKTAVEKQGLRFGVSSHDDRAWQWLHPSHGHDLDGPRKNVPYDGNLTKADGKGTWWEGYDPQDLYCRPHGGDPLAPDATYMRTGEPPDEGYKIKWYQRTRELIQKYQPDLLWFDGPMPLGEYGLRIAAEFYNNNRARHGGRPEAVLNLKSWGPGTVPDEAAVVLDIEKGLVDGIRSFPWQTDTTILPDWVYTPDPPALSDEVIIHNLCDIISKNGNLLLNVALRADGTLPDDQRRILQHVGDWLTVNGEAIYGTRPWKVYGEGPTHVQAGDFQENTRPFTAADIRYTTKGDTLYAIFLGWPADATLRLRSLTAAAAIELVGGRAPLTWDNGPDGVTVHLPKEPAGRFAYVLRIKGPQSLFASTNLLAWCIIPYDNQHRSPSERVAMLQRLGFTQYVWDWRQEHLKDLSAEIRLARQAGIQMRGVWLWIDGDRDRVGALSDSNRTVFAAIDQARLPVQFWVGFNANFYAGLDDATRVRRGAAMVAYLRTLAAASGSTIALYNHGDWFGDPENEIKIIQAVGDPSVGLIYNFHHGHDQIDRFPGLLPQMLPYLSAVTLNGMRPEGPMILPIGDGTRERGMIRLLQDSGYDGPLAILGHVEDADVEQVLRRNLAGLRRISGP